MLQGVILKNIVDFVNIVYIHCLQYFSLYLENTCTGLKRNSVFYTNYLTFHTLSNTKQ